jgi:hypothetical protein
LFNLQLERSGISIALASVMTKSIESTVAVRSSGGPGSMLKTATPSASTLSKSKPNGTLSFLSKDGTVAKVACHIGASANPPMSVKVPVNGQAVWLTPKQAKEMNNKIDLLGGKVVEFDALANVAAGGGDRAVVVSSGFMGTKVSPFDAASQPNAAQFAPVKLPNGATVYMSPVDSVLYEKSLGRVDVFRDGKPGIAPAKISSNLKRDPNIGNTGIELRNLTNNAPIAFLKIGQTNIATNIDASTIQTPVFRNKITLGAHTLFLSDAGAAALYKTTTALGAQSNAVGFVQGATEF